MKEPNKSPFELPYLAAIFNDLRRGRHICAEDGVLFSTLRDHFDSFSDLFRNLGFSLESHSRDFYYFRSSEGSLSDSASRMAVLFFILVETASGKGEAVEDSIMSGTFEIGDLPVFKSDRYRMYMHEAGVDDEEGLMNVIRSMERLGFVQRRERSFRFRVPAYRLFDLCVQILKAEPPKLEPSEDITQ
jgi:Condensin complex protein MksE